MGPTCSIVYENEPIDKSLEKIKPRKLTDSLFTWKELLIPVMQGLVIAAGILSLSWYLVESEYSQLYIRSMTFSTLIFSNILLTLTGRSNSQTILKTIKQKNNLIPLVIMLTLLLLFASLYLTAVQNVFQFTSLSVNDLLICFGIAIPLVLWIEFYKK